MHIWFAKAGQIGASSFIFAYIKLYQLIVGHLI